MCFPTELQDCCVNRLGWAHFVLRDCGRRWVLHEASLSYLLLRLLRTVRLWNMVLVVQSLSDDPSRKLQRKLPRLQRLRLLLPLLLLLQQQR